MFMLYDFIYIIYAFFYLPISFLKGKRWSGLRERFGFYNPEVRAKLSSGKSIWVHGVSVGEILSSGPLLNELRKEFPEYKLVISTTTTAGYSMARKIKKQEDVLIHFPFDLSPVVKKALGLINPVLFITMEKEFWPNLIGRLHKNSIPVLVINGRMSGASLARYQKVKFLLQSLLNKISLFCMQSKNDARRLAELGVNQNKIRITGNLKFEAVTTEEVEEEKRKKYFSQLTLDHKHLLVAGSTHKGEEEILIKIYDDLNLKNKGWILLIAPRHLERIEEINPIADKYGFKMVKVSELALEIIQGSFIYILDIMGELKTFYSLADLIFVGGSLVPFGGHNLIEPAYFSKAIIFGKHIFNFHDIAEGLIEQKAAVKVKDAEQLKEEINHLVNDKVRRIALGQEAKKMLSPHLGATQRNIEEIRKVLGR